MKKYIILTIFLILVNFSYAQENKKLKPRFFNLTEVSYSYGGRLRDYQISQNFFGIDDNAVAVFSLRNINGIYLSPHITFGVGLGYEGISVGESTTSIINNEGFNQRITTPSFFYNTLPLFADLRCYLNKSENSWFIYGDLGSALAIANNFKKGLYWGTGIGCKFPVYNVTTMNISLGFNEQYIVNSATDNERIYRIGLRVGVQF